MPPASEKKFSNRSAHDSRLQLVARRACIIGRFRAILAIAPKKSPPGRLKLPVVAE